MTSIYDDEELRAKCEAHFGPRKPPKIQKLSVPLSRLKSIIEEDMTCPVCLDRIDDTSTVTTCLHRFCTECLERNLRMNLGPKEHHDCPSCRAKLASRRSSRHDEAYNEVIKMISNVYDGYHKEEKFDVNTYKRLNEQRVAEMRKKQRQIIAKRPLLPLVNSNIISKTPETPRSQAITKPKDIKRQSSSSKSNRADSNKESRAATETSEHRICLALFPEGQSLTALPLPFLKAPPLMMIGDLKHYVMIKLSLPDQQYHLLELLMKHDDKVIVLDNAMTLVDAALMYWDMESELKVYYKLFPLSL